MTRDWVPGADLPALARRAQLLRAIREFFHRRGVLEAVTPVLGASGVTDVHIENVVVPRNDRNYYLQTSPEYFMKRLLAAGSGPIYQLGPAFRGHETGVRHNIEFTMLEWYRPGFALDDLIGEVQALLDLLLEEFECAAKPFTRHRYKDLFIQRWGENPHLAGLDRLRRLAAALPASHITDHGDTGTRNDYLDLLFSQGIEPALADPVVVRDYPASQAALAEIGEDDEGTRVALRFECLWQGVELANGYLELRDAGELQGRMAENNRLRHARGLPEIEADGKLLAALPHMPACCGVALGVDRLLMLLTGKQQLDQVMAFSDQRL